MDLSLFIWLLAFDIGEIYDLKMNFLLLSSTWKHNLNLI